MECKITLAYIGWPALPGTHKEIASTTAKRTTTGLTNKNTQFRFQAKIAIMVYLISSATWRHRQKPAVSYVSIVMLKKKTQSSQKKIYHKLTEMSTDDVCEKKGTRIQQRVVDRTQTANETPSNALDYTKSLAANRPGDLLFATAFTTKPFQDDEHTVRQERQSRLCVSTPCWAFGT